jgi:hypothetical protein
MYCYEQRRDAPTELHANNGSLQVIPNRENEADQRNQDLLVDF